METGGVGGLQGARVRVPLRVRVSAPADLTSRMRVLLADGGSRGRRV